MIFNSVRSQFWEIEGPQKCTQYIKPNVCKMEIAIFL